MIPSFLVVVLLLIFAVVFMTKSSLMMIEKRKIFLFMLFFFFGLVLCFVAALVFYDLFKEAHLVKSLLSFVTYTLILYIVIKKGEV